MYFRSNRYCSRVHRRCGSSLISSSLQAPVPFSSRAMFRLVDIVTRSVAAEQKLIRVCALTQELHLRVSFLQSSYSTSCTVIQQYTITTITTTLAFTTLRVIAGIINCGSWTMHVDMVRDIGGLIHHFGKPSGAPPSVCTPVAVLLSPSLLLRRGAGHRAIYRQIIHDQKIQSTFVITLQSRCVYLQCINVELWVYLGFPQQHWKLKELRLALALPQGHPMNLFSFEGLFNISPLRFVLLCHCAN